MVNMEPFASFQEVFLVSPRFRMQRIRTAVSGIVVALLMVSQLPVTSFSAWSLFDATTTFAQASQVSVTKSAPTEAHPGEPLYYSIVVRNNGATSVTGELTDPVQNFTAHLTLVPNESGSSSHTGTQCVTDPGGEVSCSPVTLGPGEVAVYYLKFNVGLSAPCSGTFNNVASFTYDPGNITVNSNSSATTYSCPPTVDLRVEKTGPATVAQGGVIVYTVSAVHVSGPTATNVLVQDPAPNGVAFNAAQSDPSCSQQADIIICSTPSLAPGARKDFAIAFTVPQQAACGSVISNTAALCSADQEDPVPGNDVFNGTINTTVTCAQTADLSIQKSGPQTIVAGNVISYSVTAANAGPNTAQNVVISDVVPAGLTFNAAQSSNNCALNGNGTSVLCNNFSLNSGESRSFTITFNLPQPGNACQQTTVQNQATVSSSTTDPNAANNASSTVSTTVTCPQPQGADVSVSKFGPGSVQQGSNVSYTLSASNAGPGTATNVVVSDVIPAGLAFNAAQSSNNCVLNGNGTAVLCNNFNLVSGESRSFTVVFTTMAPGQNCQQSTLQNQATVSTSSTDPNSNNNTSATVFTNLTCPAPAGADLLVVKSGPQTVVRGGTISYSVTAINAGPGTATNVVIADVIPAGLTFNAAQSSPECVLNGNGTSVLCNNFNLTSGQSRGFTITFNVPNVQNCQQSTLQNQATVSSSSTDPNSANNTSSTVSTTATCPPPVSAVLSLNKSGPSSVVRGNVFSYTLTVSNGNQATAQNVVVTDPVPFGLSFQSAGSDPSCSVQGNVVSCSAGTLSPNQSRSFTLNFQAPAVSPCSQTTVQNQATATSNQSSAVQSQVVFTTVTCPVVNQADIVVTKSASTQARPGQTVQYSIIVRNNGSQPVTGELLDPVGNFTAHLTLVPGQSGSSTHPGVQCVTDPNGDVSCSPVTINPGSVAAFLLTFNVSQAAPCSGTFQNIAQFITDPGNVVFSSNTSSTSFSCPPQVDLRIEKTGPVTVTQGGVIVYTVSAIHVSGPAASNVLVQDPAPNGVIFNPALSDPSCYQNADLIICSTATLAPGARKDFALAFTVPQQTACGTVITNTAAICKADQQDPVPGNDVFNGSVNTTVICPQPQTADVSVQKSGPATALAGGTVSYSVTATNAGPGTATNVVVSDVIPAGLTFNAGLSSNSCALNGNGTAVLCSNFSLNAGESRTFTLTFTLPQVGQNCTQSTVQNQATVSSSVTDPNSSNNASATIYTQLVCPQPQGADLLVFKNGPSTALRGSTVAYSVSVINAGPATAQNVIVTDIVPAGLTFNAGQSSPSCALNQAQTAVQCTVAGLAANQSQAFAIVFDAPLIQNCTQQNVQNQATVTSSTADPAQSNNASAVVVTRLDCPAPAPAVLTIQKAGPQSVQRGSTFSYTLIVTNTSQTSAQNVTVTDPVPFGLTYQATGSDPSCSVLQNDVVCNIGTLAAGQTRTLTLNFQAPAADPCAQAVVQNRAFVTSSQSNLAQSQIVNTTIDCPAPQGSDLSITKSGPSTVQNGAIASYTLVATNAGPAAAQNVVVSDVLPAGTTFNAGLSSPECVLNGNGTSVLCTTASLGSGQSRTFIISVTVTSQQTCTPRAITNQATVSSSSVDPNSANNVSSVVTTQVTCPVLQTADLTLEKSGPSTVTRGGTLTYTLTVRNIGGQQALNVFVTDPVPAGLTFQSSGSSTTCSLQGGSVSCNVGTLAANESRVLTLVFSVPEVSSCTQTTVQNIAAATTTSAESTTSNNQSTTVTTSILCPNVQFAIQKTDNRSTVQPGENVTYTITVQNLSSTNASSVMVTDPMPSLFAFTSASDGGFLNGNTVTWNNLFIGANSSRTLTLQGQISPGASNGNVITNTASVNGVSATDTTVVQTGGGTGQSLAIDISDSPDPVRPDEVLTYTIRLTNLNSNTVSNLTMTQTLPGDVRFLSATDGGYSSGQSVTWNNLTLSGNQTRTFTVSVRVDDDARDGQSLYTSAYAGNASDSETTLVRDDDRDDVVRIDVTGTPDDVCADDTITYTIAVRNDDTGSSTTDLYAYLDSRTAFESASDGGRNLGSGEVRWDNIRVNRYSTEFVTLRARVRPGTFTDTIRLRVRSQNGRDDDEETTHVRANCSLPLPPPSENLSLFVSKQADRQEAQAGDTVYYSVTVRNVSNFAASNVTVEDTFPSQQMTIHDAGNGIVSGNMIRWTVGALGANETRTFTYSGVLQANLRQGDTVQNSVRVTADNLGAIPNAVATVRIIQILPATGAGFTGPLDTAAALLRPFSSNSSSTMPSIVWLSIALMGMAAGGGIGKRYFFSL